MDFRDRNPNISFWHSGSKGLTRETYPFEGPNITHICEFLPPDQSTVFLCLTGGFVELENHDITSHYYLIEAPKPCPMRQAFELGKLTWEDFWHHKGWLIEATFASILSVGFHVRYVHPTSMSRSAQLKGKRFLETSPIQLKYEALCCKRARNDLSPYYAAQLEDLEKKFADAVKIVA